MELTGPWEATLATETSRRTWLGPDGSTAEQGAPVEWHPIEVPGHWRSNPAFADSDGPLLYRTRIAPPPPRSSTEPETGAGAGAGAEAGTADRLWLNFEGTFYQGDVWLDGTYVGDTEGYFFPHTFEVTDALRGELHEGGEHTLGIELTCRPESDRSAKRNITGAFQDWNGLDPTWNPGGIWRPVTLDRTGPVRIRHLRVVCSEANETRATVKFRAVLDAADGGEITLRSTVGEVELVDQRRVAAGENQVEWQLRIDDPELWWPHALGSQPMHDVVVEVTVHPDPESHELPAGIPVSHRVCRRIGLRQVSLRAWVLHVNGERMFLKGSNQGPNLMALAEATPESFVEDVALAKAANLDLLRVHAHVSRPELYDAADEAGLLLWQDFPLQWSYSRSIRKQAQRQAREMVDLLGHHPSVAIWCAHNEPFNVEGRNGTPRDPTAKPAKPSKAARYLTAQELPSWNRSILDRSVKRAIDKADGSRPVIPHSGVLPHPPQLDGTDSHLYFGWHHGEERDLPGFARLMPRVVRFVSEFGTQSVPESAGFCEPERWPDLPWDRLTSRHAMQKEQFDRWVPPVDHPSFDSWRTASQQYQATVIRHHVETLRRLKYRPTGGFAHFCFADGHPAMSGSVLDHERNPKLAYEVLREACRPVIVVADRLPAELGVGETIALDVHVVSDLRTPMQDIEVNARLAWAGGEHRWRFGGDIDADAVQRVGTLQIEVPDAPGPITLELEMRGFDLPDGSVTRTDASHVVVRQR